MSSKKIRCPLERTSPHKLERLDDGEYLCRTCRRMVIPELRAVPHAVHLEIDIHVDGPNVPGIQKFVEELCCMWEEGRWLYSEVLRKEIKSIVGVAVEKAVGEKYWEKYGNEMVRVSENSRTARAVLETSKELDSAPCRVLSIAVKTGSA